VDYYERKFGELIIKLDDGDTISYDNISKSIRTMPIDANLMTEDECKYEFGLRLQRLMWRSGLTQERLSILTGITQPLLSSYVSGKRMPGLYNLDKLAKALDCSVDDFRYW
jgi:DNA-binding Xre family transcriptional regulator